LAKNVDRLIISPHQSGPFRATSLKHNYEGDFFLLKYFFNDSWKTKKSWKSSVKIFQLVLWFLRRSCMLRNSFFFEKIFFTFTKTIVSTLMCIRSLLQGCTCSNHVEIILISEKIKNWNCFQNFGPISVFDPFFKENVQNCKFSQFSEVF